MSVDLERDLYFAGTLQEKNLLALFKQIEPALFDVSRFAICFEVKIYT